MLQFASSPVKGSKGSYLPTAWAPTGPEGCVQANCFVLLKSHWSTILHSPASRPSWRSPSASHMHKAFVFRALWALGMKTEVQLGINDTLGKIHSITTRILVMDQSLPILHTVSKNPLGGDGCSVNASSLPKQPMPMWQQRQEKTIC